MDTLKKPKDEIEEKQLELYKFLGSPLKLQETSDPSDIFWESEKQTGCKRVMIIIGVVISAVLLSCLFFSMVFLLKTKSYQLKRIFPNND